MTAKKTTKTTTKKTTKATAPKEKKLSALSAASKVLAEAKGSMTTKEMVETMGSKGYWSSPGGKTPHATLYAAILREITTKGKESRFKKTEPGKFAATGVTTTKTEKPAKTKSKRPCPACGVEGFTKGGKCSVCGHEATKTTKAQKAKATEDKPA
ncbi:MAG TPA: winged helix-turn-helix domain-containing protein [Gemmata sp.]|nr:winged helix-turn-helix domain-containing protein [Gemmata sp.]